jgi:hypothetical protein
LTQGEETEHMEAAKKNDEKADMLADELQNIRAPPKATAVNAPALAGVQDADAGQQRRA